MVVVVTKKMLNEMLRLAPTGLTHAEIGRLVGGVSRQAVCRWLLKSGVRKYRGAANKAAIARLHQDKVAPGEICRRLGISDSTYFFHRVSLNIPPTPRPTCLRMAGRATADNGTNSFTVRAETIRNQNYLDGFPWCTNFERKVLEYLIRNGEATIGQYAEATSSSVNACSNYFKGLKRMEWVIPVSGRRTRRSLHYVLSPLVAERLRIAGHKVKKPAGVMFKASKVKGELKYTATG